MDMANVLFGIETTQFRYDYKYVGTGVFTQEPIEYEDFKIQVSAAHNTNDYTREEGYSFTHVHEILRNAKEGTNVIVHLSTFYCELFDQIFVFIGKLADKYSKLNFFVTSLIATPYEEGTHEIIEFNNKMKLKIEIVEFSNLKYKDILYNNNPRQISLDNKAIDILNYISEGSFFFKSGYIKIFKAMIEGL